jgi:hypothetical protein
MMHCQLYKYSFCAGNVAWDWKVQLGDQWKVSEVINGPWIKELLIFLLTETPNIPSSDKSWESGFHGLHLCSQMAEHLFWTVGS